jgi:hypothetical protein
MRARQNRKAGTGFDTKLIRVDGCRVATEVLPTDRKGVISVPTCIAKFSHFLLARWNLSGMGKSSIARNARDNQVSGLKKSRSNETV